MILAFETKDDFRRLSSIICLQTAFLTMFQQRDVPLFSVLVLLVVIILAHLRSHFVLRTNSISSHVSEFEHVFLPLKQQMVNGRRLAHDARNVRSPLI